MDLEYFLEEFGASLALVIFIAALLILSNADSFTIEWPVKP